MKLSAFALATVVMACTAQVAPQPNPHPPVVVENDGTCALPERIISAASPFETALARWAAEGSTSGVRIDLERACGTELEAPSTHRMKVLNGEPGACTLFALILAVEDHDSVAADRFFQRSAMTTTRSEAFDLGGCHDGSTSWSRSITSMSTSCCRGLRGCERGCESKCDDAASTIRKRVLVPLEQACARGRGIACHMLGRAQSLGMSMEGIGRILEGGGDVDGLHERACNANVGLSCRALASSIASHERFAPGRDMDAPLSAETVRKVASLDKRACALDTAEGCLELGLAARARGDKTEAATHFDRACVLGMQGVCRDLAEMYTSGNELPRDGAKASRFEELSKRP